MTAEQLRRTWPGPEYVVRQRFRAPMEFVFAWCTDFTEKDPSIEGEEYERKILSRGPRRVVYEDVGADATGWSWSRHEVSLHPPNSWHLEGVGNRRRLVGDYVLREVKPGLVELELRWRRRPGLLPFTKLRKVPLQRESQAGWRRFAAALEHDYRTARKRSARGRS